MHPLLKRFRNVLFSVTVYVTHLGLGPPILDHRPRWSVKSRTILTADGAGTAQGFHNPQIPLDRIGSVPDWSAFRLDDLAAVYVLNKARAPPCADRVKFGLLRTYAVQEGWFQSQAEVRYESRPDRAISTMSHDLRGRIDDRIVAKDAAFLVPFLYEMVGVGFGFHTSMELRLPLYRDMATMCMAPLVNRYMSPWALYDLALRWVRPELVQSMLKAFYDSEKLLGHKRADIIRRLLIFHEIRLQKPLSADVVLERRGSFRNELIRVPDRTEHVALSNVAVKSETPIPEIQEREEAGSRRPRRHLL